MAHETDQDAPHPAGGDRRRGWALGLGVGLAVFTVALAIGLSIVALPLFFLASVVEPTGRIDHPFLREGLLRWALPVGLVLGLASGTAVGVWVGKGGRLPEPDDLPSYLR